MNSIRYFGVKARLGAHSRTKLIHSATAARVHDSEMLHELLHGQRRGLGDAAYSGQRDMIRQHNTHRCRQSDSCQSPSPLSLERGGAPRHRTKSIVRAKAKHVFLVIKRLFELAKVRYRGLMKSTSRVLSRFHGELS